MSRLPNQNLENLALPDVLRTDRPKGDQVREILEDLVSGLSAGTPLPSERSLAERYGVARMTIRSEIRSLAADGVVTVRPGSGAFVADSPRQPRAVGASYSRDMRQRGKTPGAQVLEHNILLVTRRLANKLEVPAGTKALRLVRLRTADGEPMGLERTTISLAHFPGLEDIDMEDASLYDTIRDHWGVEPVSVSARASAVLPSPDEAELLEISGTTPCLLIDSLQRGSQGMVIETGRSIYRGDLYDLDISYQLVT